MNKPKRLLEKIVTGIQEVGIQNFLCQETSCDKKGKSSFGRDYCLDAIPYVCNGTTLGNTQKIRIIELCHYKIMEYWKK